MPACGTTAVPRRVQDLARAHGGPCGRGRMRERAEDFRVDEVLGFSPTGTGSHAWLQVEKRGANTHWVAGQLARCAAVTARAVGYSGMKDRHAVTRQWFSVDLAGAPMPDWQALPDGVDVLILTRSQRKLRRGAHRANRFVLRVRLLDADSACVAARLDRITGLGVPNYFGAQRFGRGHANLQAAARLLVEGRRERDRHRRGLALSAARSWLFNQYLHRRVVHGTWATLMDGDHVQRDGLPSGPMWGRGESLASGEAGALEQAVAAGLDGWARGLEAAGLRHERRPLVCRPDDLSWDLQPDWLELRFTLPRGQFATALLREILDTGEESGDADCPAGTA